MTEEEWKTTRDPHVLLEHLHTAGWTTERKVQLFTVACCRRVEHLFFDPRQPAAVDVLERYADGLAGADELVGVNAAVQEVGVYDPDMTLGADDDEVGMRWAAGEMVNHATAPGSDRDGIPNWYRRAYIVVRYAVQVGERVDMLTGTGWEAPAQRQRVSDILLCVFGNPFRPVAFEPRWRTETAVALAAGIYEQRVFDRLPILADALEDAGCDVAELLNHLRGPGPHVRGCWAVDLVLGKS